MALAAVAFAKASRRRRITPCTISIGPGATNVVTAGRISRSAGEHDQGYLGQSMAVAALAA
jgi:hypothetical protein